ncbi:MAG: antitoxin [Acidimicrobiia bacterium]
MGLFDKMKDLAGEHADKLDGVVDKVAEVVDDRTGGEHTDKIESAAEKAKGFLEDTGGEGGGGGEPPSRLSP